MSDVDELLALPLGELLARLASDAPAPAGGALAAIAAAGAAAMVEMGANLTRARERYAAYWPEMEVVRDRAQQLRMQLVELVAEDGRAYAGVIEALRLPQDTDAGRRERQAALDAATLAAAGPPGRVLAAAAELAELAAAVAERGNVNLVGDATTAAVIAESAGRAAAMLVEIDAGMSRAPGAVEALATARVDAVRAADARTRALSAADMRRPRGL
jgi:glutamate formiminotransferase/formiminotetrahydrofolate cyclodeaminase